jgi:signal transduction histidine kinase
VSEGTKLLAEFTAIDAEQFARFISSLGFSAGACYRFAGSRLIQIIAPAAKAWPQALLLNSNYTMNHVQTPVGWGPLERILAEPVKLPNLMNFYLPDQGLDPVRVCFFLSPSNACSQIPGDLDGAFEALGHRIAAILADSEKQTSFDRAQAAEHLRQFTRNLVQVINHEVRTPLTAVRGHAGLLSDASNSPEVRESAEIIEDNLGQSLVAIDRLSALISATGGEGNSALADDAVDMEEVCRSVAIAELDRDLKHKASPGTATPRISIHTEDPGKLAVTGNKARLAMAVSEVIKNAIAFTRSGDIEIYLANSAGMVVIDVMDDGEGVAPGAENLIFLNFFQDRTQGNPVRGRKGLGVGLFLARSIIGEHLGSLEFVRSHGRIGFFRFMIPEVRSEKLSSDVVIGS